MVAPGPGILLIADPFLKDPHFMRTVVFICEHQPEGTFGFVLNKKFEQTMDELITNFDGFPLPVYYGGPVQIDTIHFLHQYPELIPGGHQVMDGVYWGGDFKAVTALIKNEEIDMNKIRFFIGYSGWGQDQLTEEISEKTWLTVPATRTLIFNDLPEEIWKDSLKHLGGEYQMLANFPIDPQLN
jgi:putative transcriptional regulator